MTQVIKIGGALLQDAAKSVATLRAVIDGPTIVVHGGGIQITTMIKRMGLSSTFVDGLRVTDGETLAAVSLALLGEVHCTLVQAMHAAGLPAIGIFGGMYARKRTGPLGFVGTDLRADSASFCALLEANKIPVVPTLAVNHSSLLNVNGDETAAALAVALAAERLVFLTDVPGVRDAAGDVINRAADVDELLEAEFVSGGMRPKLLGVKVALAGGVRRVLVGQTVFEGAS